MKIDNISYSKHRKFSSNKPHWRPNYKPTWNNSRRPRRNHFNKDFQPKKYVRCEQVDQKPISQWSSGKQLNFDQISTEGSRKSSKEVSIKKGNYQNTHFGSILSNNSSECSPTKM
jgi:hypothetical protein